MNGDFCASISRPLFSWRELIDWSPSDRHRLRPEDCRSRVPVASSASRSSSSHRPKLLVCHDMKGGYLEDRFIQGVTDADCYRFNRWWSVDTFVYFSHHFVTLPPPCWIDAGHRHGVKVLGTLITEWEAGIEICEEFLKDEVTFRNTADQMVRMAQYYQFDGWLINIENKLSSEKTLTLKEFLCYLTKQMHLHVDQSEVIWYDSITMDGSLSWQNELNSKNACFFESCDGIFLNYTWKESNLRSTADLATAYNRLTDVYVGVDVFGRGCFGGGGFNTDAAVAVAASLNLSVALFGIGWTHECLKDGQNFTDNDERFWSLLQKFCKERKIISLPLVTSFCQGWGKKYYCKGQVLKDECWTSLSLQQLQPTDVCKTDALLYDTSDGYFGGGCLKLIQSKNISQVRLFSLDVALTDNLFISYTYKTVVAGQFLIVITLKKRDSMEKINFGLPNEDGYCEETVVCNIKISTIKSSDVTTEPTSDGSSWITREFCVSDVSSCQLVEISVVFLDNPDLSTFRLGELQVKHESKISVMSDALKTLQDGRTVKGRLNLMNGPRIIAEVTPEPKSDDVLKEISTEKQSACEPAVTEIPRGEAAADKDGEKTKTVHEDYIGQNLKLTWDLTDDSLREIDRFHVFVWSAKNQAWYFLGHTPICSYSCYLGFESEDLDLRKFKLDIVLISGKIIVDINVFENEITANDELVNVHKPAFKVL